ncbi:hypothetical protein [Zeaxanthinibacter enoshimensis]|nr:hypothetical protein [Zeaxanthinibacter enoshimensis]
MSSGPACPVVVETIEGTWTFDSGTHTITIYYPNDYKANLYAKYEEIYPEKSIKRPRIKLQLTIESWTDGVLMAEKTTPNNGYEP